MYKLYIDSASNSGSVSLQQTQYSQGSGADRVRGAEFEHYDDLDSQHVARLHADHDTSLLDSLDPLVPSSVHMSGDALQVEASDPALHHDPHPVDPFTSFPHHLAGDACAVPLQLEPLSPLSVHVSEN